MTSDSRSLAPASCRTPMKRSLLARCYASIDMKTYELLGEDGRADLRWVDHAAVGSSRAAARRGESARDGGRTRSAERRRVAPAGRHRYPRADLARPRRPERAGRVPARRPAQPMTGVFRTRSQDRPNPNRAAPCARRDHRRQPECWCGTSRPSTELPSSTSSPCSTAAAH